MYISTLDLDIIFETEKLFIIYAILQYRYFGLFHYDHIDQFIEYLLTMGNIMWTHLFKNIFGKICCYVFARIFPLLVASNVVHSFNV